MDIGGAEAQPIAEFGQAAAQLRVGIMVVVGGMVVVSRVVGQHVADFEVRLGQRRLVTRRELLLSPSLGIGQFADDGILVVALAHVVVEHFGVVLVELVVVVPLLVVEVGAHDVGHKLLSVFQLSAEIEVERRAETPDGSAL